MPAQLLAEADERPRLLFFHSVRCGRCRRAESFLAEALQYRHNHDTFRLLRVSVDDRPELMERFGVEQLPTLFVIEGGKTVRTIVAPRGSFELKRELAPWLH